MSTPQTPPPYRSPGRAVAEATIKGIAGAAPAVGPALQEFLGLVLGARHQERMQTWLTELADAVTVLQQEGKARNWEDLLDDDTFIDVVLTATRAASATSRQEKLRALRTAVMTSAGPSAPGEDLERRFIDIVDRATPDHLSLLLALHDPQRTFTLAGVAWADVVDRAESVLPWGSEAEPPAKMWAGYMREGIHAQLVETYPVDRDVTFRLERDLENWQLFESGVSYALDATFLSPLGEQLLSYVGISGATAAAFEAFRDANH